MNGLFLALLTLAIPSNAQQDSKDAPAKTVTTFHSQADRDTIVVSGISTTARIADPNEKVVFNGRVMRMADFVAAVSSSSASVQRLHSPEKHSHEKVQPVQQSPQPD